MQHGASTAYAYEPQLIHEDAAEPWALAGKTSRTSRLPSATTQRCLSPADRARAHAAGDDVRVEQAVPGCLGTDLSGGR